MSDPVNGLDGFGLSETGRRQVAATIHRSRNDLAHVTRIISSDFRRTRETAEIAAEMLKSQLELDIRLRERFFGEFELCSSDHYDQVWQQDRFNSSHTLWNVESPAAVARRMKSCIDEQQQQSPSEDLLFVSHGDPLQILLTLLQGLDPAVHRQRASLHPADLVAV